VTFRQLLVPVNDQDQQKVIKQVDADLAANKNFEELVKQFSSGPRSDQGGLYQLKQSQLEDRFPPVPEVVKGLEVGEYSEWFPCRGYAHKILLEERIPGGPLNFADAQGQIRAILRDQLRAEKQVRFERELWKKAQVELFIPGVQIPKFS
jgi:parvulin-like peptidyl-prolyl isomerase